MSEGDVVDFKREQYPLTSDAEKAELIKDVLAFANGWRTDDAFILVGVDEEPGQRAKVVGVTKHLKDADLQQMVNSKLSAPVVFGYHSVTIDELDVGVIRVEKGQDRPLFLKANFGRLKANVVYVRRGSSTAEADPNEVARMGVARVVIVDTPQIALDLVDGETGESIGGAIPIVSKSLSKAPPATSLMSDLLGAGHVLAAEIAAQRHALEISTRNFGGPTAAELVAFRKESALMRPVRIVARNLGGLVKDARVLLSVPKKTGLRVSADRPERPTGPLGAIVGRTRWDPPGVVVTDKRDHWEVEVPLGKIQPHAEVTSRSIWVGSEHSCRFDLKARIFADNIVTPIEVSVDVFIRVETGWLKEADDDEADDD